MTQLISNPTSIPIQDKIRQIQILNPGISQQKLADRFGVPRRTLRRWMSGETKTTTPQRQKKVSRVFQYERKKVTDQLPYLKSLPVTPPITGFVDIDQPLLDLRYLTNDQILDLVGAAGDMGFSVQFQIRLAITYYDRDGRGTSVIQTKPFIIDSAALQDELDRDEFLTKIYNFADMETDFIEAARIKYTS